MNIRDIMTTNVVTIPSNTSIADARRIMQAHKFRRLPVVDRGKLVGVVTERRLEHVSPSKATSLSVWELTYLLAKTPIKEIMETKVTTVSPDMTIEAALAFAQAKKVGSLVVVENGKVVGIVTTNDFFYKIANPALGIGQRGTRFLVTGGGDAQALEKILSVLNRLAIKLTNILVIAVPEAAKKDAIVHVDKEDVTELVAELKSQGFEVTVRQR